MSEDRIVVNLDCSRFCDIINGKQWYSTDLIADGLMTGEMRDISVGSIFRFVEYKKDKETGRTQDAIVFRKTRVSFFARPWKDGEMSAQKAVQLAVLKYQDCRAATKRIRELKRQSFGNAAGAH